jgi:phage virion morphogenesis protein
MADLAALHTWLDPLLARLSPGERATLASLLAKDLRRTNAARIRANVTPDGAAMAPRKPQRRGAIRRRAMFRRLGTVGAMRAAGNSSAATVTFTGRLARIAAEHHGGGRYPVRPGGPVGDYAARPLLGFGEADVAMIQDRILARLAEGLAA